MREVAAFTPETVVPSKTSLWSAAARALGTHDPDPGVRNPDWLAEWLIGPQERASLRADPLIASLDRDYRTLPTAVTRSMRYMMQRTRFVDESLTSALESGISQVVVVGAGLDSRALRFHQILRGVAIFELDAPATQQYKRRRVEAVLGFSLPKVDYVEADLECIDLSEALHATSYERGQPTLFIVEGVTMYLSDRGLRDLFSCMAEASGCRSVVVFDYWTREHIERADPVTAERLRMTDAWSEPIRGGLPAGTARHYLERQGFELLEELPFGGDEATRRYLTRRDGTIVGASLASADAGRAEPPGAWLARACTGRPPSD